MTDLPAGNRSAIPDGMSEAEISFIADSRLRSLTRSSPRVPTRNMDVFRFAIETKEIFSTSPPDGDCFLKEKGTYAFNMYEIEYGFVIRAPRFHPLCSYLASVMHPRSMNRTLCH